MWVGIAVVFCVIVTGLFQLAARNGVNDVEDVSCVFQYVPRGVAEGSSAIQREQQPEDGTDIFARTVDETGRGC